MPKLIDLQTATSDRRFLLARIPIALVWLFEGLWNKLLGTRTDQLQIASAMTGLTGTAAQSAIWMLGLLECGLAVWVLWGTWPRAAALVQTLVLVGMNAVGLYWTSRLIPHPGQMLVMNLAFLTLAWLTALEPRFEDRE